MVYATRYVSLIGHFETLPCHDARRFARRVEDCDTSPLSMYPIVGIDASARAKVL
jgi:hypothetical protein